MARLQNLFEKMVGGCASHLEQRELQMLYVEYINFGRKSSKRHLQAVGQ